MRLVGTASISPHQSGEFALTRISWVDTTRSGVPIAHVLRLSNFRGGGMSAGLPCGAPLSAHVPIIAISASDSDGSFLYCWMPTFFSMYHGGITPRCGPIDVRCLIARAYGRTSSYVTRDIGATPSERWQFWQLRCRIGAMCLVKVGSAGIPAACALVTVNARADAARIRRFISC